MKRYLSVLTLGLLTAAIPPLATAQTTPASTDRPTPVGTSQQTADQANQKAIKDGGTATVVRTGPSAADHVRGAAATAEDKANKAKTTVKAKTKSTTTDDTTTTGTTTAKP